MNKEFIPYEQALELKELGFNEPCFCFFNPKYSINDLLFGNIDGEFDNWNIQTDLISAPLYQQAFRWFRENYEYFIDLFVDDNRQFGFMITKFIIYDRIDSPIARKYLTYEEAELACLKKLIEIVKNKPQKEGRIQDISIG